MRYLVVLLCLIPALAGCRRAPPEYVANYTPTAPSTTVPTLTPAPSPIQASFVDTFDRPDTELGLGEGWDMRTYVDSFPMPAATEGFIRNGGYTYAGDSVVNAARQFRATVRRMGTVGRFRQAREGNETTLAMAITANDRIITHMVHFAANRGTWELTVRRGGAFEPVAKGQFTPALELDRDYEFEIEATDTAVTVRVPGDEVTENVSTVRLLSDRAFWEEYAKPAPAGVVFDFDTGGRLRMASR